MRVFWGVILLASIFVFIRGQTYAKWWDTKSLGPPTPTARLPAYRRIPARFFLPTNTPAPARLPTATPPPDAYQTTFFGF